MGAIAFDVKRDGREICRSTARGRLEYRDRMMAMAVRQGWDCGLCGLPLRGDVTFDHELGRGMGGSIRDDRIEIAGKPHNAAVHYKCNMAKGSRRIPYVIQ